MQATRVKKTKPKTKSKSKTKTERDKSNQTKPIPKDTNNKPNMKHTYHVLEATESQRADQLPDAIARDDDRVEGEGQAQAGRVSEQRRLNEGLRRGLVEAESEPHTHGQVAHHHHIIPDRERDQEK
jgi:hypothetical protein